MAKGSLSWQALEYEHVEKSSDWYWAVGIIAFSIALISIILGNIIFAIVIVISTFALLVSANRKPKLVEFSLSKQGLHIDDEFYQYNTLKSFWVDNNSHHDGRSQLFFRPRGMTAQIIHIPLDDIDPDEVRDYLLDMLLEEEHVESVLHKIFEYLGF